MGVFSKYKFYLLDENGNCNLLERLLSPTEVLLALLHGLDVAVVETSNNEWVDTFVSENYSVNKSGQGGK